MGAILLSQSCGNAVSYASVQLVSSPYRLCPTCRAVRAHLPAWRCVLRHGRDMPAHPGRWRVHGESAATLVRGTRYCFRKSLLCTNPPHLTLSHASVSFVLATMLVLPGPHLSGPPSATLAMRVFPDCSTPSKRCAIVDDRAVMIGVGQSHKRRRAPFATRTGTRVVPAMAARASW